jgi:SAM-dependent methyltransferase
MTHLDAQYADALSGEGEFWDSFTAQRLRRGEIPGSIDWRLTFTQFRYNHDWRPLCLGAEGINFRLPEIRYVLATAAPRPGMRILDLGCGAGWLSLELARRGAHVTALDISETNLALARYMAENNTRNFPFLYQGFAGLPCRLEDFGSVEYEYADLNNVGLPPGEYDAVVVWDSLHHVQNLERLLEEVLHTLKPNGVFIGMDHAYATPRTEAFNRAMLPLLDDFCAWVSREDPVWLYGTMNMLGAAEGWGALSIDYDATPVSGFAQFLEILLPEMVEIIDGSSKGRSSEVAVQAGVQEESPFEDVSAERLMRVLLQEFTAREFRTVSPFVEPARHIPHYRDEGERIFQHYLATALIAAGESAIRHEQADGQWFLFNLAPNRPVDDSQLKMLPPENVDPIEPYIFALETISESERAALQEHNRIQQLTIHEHSRHIAHQRAVIEEQLAYTSHLEGEYARKEAAVRELEAQVQLLEAQLTQAREPRLPWKKRKR